jgi:hypothetical protein
MAIVEAPEAFLFQRLTSQTSVYTLIGTRVFPMMAPTGTALPLVIYQRSSVSRQQSLSGPVGLPVVTLQLTSYASSYTAVKSIARAVRVAVDGWTGTTSGVTIQRTSLQAESDGMVLPQDDQSLPVYSVDQTFDFRIVEAMQ